MLNQLTAFYEVLLSHVSNLAIQYIPRFGHGILILAIGWLVAALGRKILQVLLRAIGIDVFLGKLGIDKLIEQGKISRKPSQLIAMLFYGLAWFVSILMALDVLGLETASLLLENLVSYLPKVITSLIMLGLGLYAVDFVVDLLRDIYFPSRPSLAPTVVAITRWGLTLLVIFAVTEYLGIAKSLITLLLTASLGGAALTLVLAFGIGGIEMAKDILAGYSLRRHLKVGDAIHSNDEKLQIRRIALTATELEKGDEVVLISNSVLIGDRLCVSIAENKSPDR